MDIINFILFLVIGLFSGLLAGLILRGSGLGLACDVVAGIVGGLIGGILMGVFGEAGQPEFFLYAGAAVGATIVIMLAGPIKRRL
ncbi:MAG: GlsB/YeaQ/YmgE family stress response membrane protein [Gammaproteobacteria bacterium]|nr:GlsB/YeaQ/YmgE family stress response membrane protein [Gammaproteobacteria bacterium]